MQVVLETTVLIAYLRGRPVVDRVAMLRRRGDATLATGNPAHFQMRGLILEHWPVGQ
jgi:hypothetical protein